MPLCNQPPLPLPLALFAFAAILGFALLAHLRFRRFPERTLSAAWFAVVGILYAASLFDLLHPATMLLVVAGLVCGMAALALGWQYHEPGTRLKSFFTPGIRAICVIVVFFCLIFGNAAFHDWDDYSHWGIYTKILCTTDQLPNRDSPLMFFDYPPGANLAQYFIARCITGSEAAAYLGAVLFLLLPLLPATCGMKRAWDFRFLLLLFLTGHGLLLLGQRILTLYVDPMLATMWAGLVIMYVTTRPRAWSWIFMGPMLFVLPLIKKTGVIFALAGLGICLALRLVDWLAEKKISGREPEPGQPRTWIAGALSVLILTTLPFAAQATWQHHCDRAGFTRTWQGKKQPASEKWKIALLGGGTALQQKTRANFIRALWHQRISRAKPRRRLAGKFLRLFLEDWKRWTPQLSFLEWLGLCVLILVGAGFLAADRTRKAQAWSLVPILLLLSLVYATGLLVLYQFSFSTYEGPRLASFCRYMNSFLLGAWLIAVTVFIHALREQETRRDSPILLPGGFRLRRVVLVLLVLFCLVETPRPCDIPLRASAPRQRVRLLPWACWLGAHAKPEWRIYFIHQGSKGLEHLIMRYDSLPARVGNEPSSLGKPLYPGDVWTAGYSREQWEGILTKKGYTHVFVSHADPGFWQDFGPLFAAGRRLDDTLFKVIRVNPNTPAVNSLHAQIKLVPVREADMPILALIRSNP